ncbi:hypothetical protein [Caulobacter phage KcrB]|nr:hypothetical protein RW_GP028 [Caulobacter phage RW]WCA46332.1 hypothetical protein [Caulobacter phage KcrB]WCD56267.1 hypothetical protein [Caulobacter phage RLK]WNV48059.1 hypothetical protein GB2A_gp027 [Caulobacter phage GB2A]
MSTDYLKALCDRTVQDLTGDNAMTYQYQPGDVVRVKDSHEQLTVREAWDEADGRRRMRAQDDLGLSWGVCADDVELVRYADGFIPWGGGANPAPGKRVKYRLRDGYEGDSDKSDYVAWQAGLRSYSIVAYKVIDDDLAQSKDHEPGLAQSKAAAKPHDYKVGDRVRITAEFTVCDANPYGVSLSHDRLSNYIEATYTELADLKPERLEPPLGVGDRVRTPGGVHGVVVALHGSEAWVSNGDDGCATYDIADLERA